jgi:peptide/nickel transport system substrate-binding protein
MQKAGSGRMPAVFLAGVMALMTFVAGCGGAPAAKQEAPKPGAAQQQPAAAAGTPKRGGTIKVGIYSDPSTLDPHKSGAMYDRHYYYQIFDTIVTVDKDGNIKPGLAESWESPDPKTYIFHFRKGVKFHDGTDFNAESARWNFERMLDPKAKLPRASEISAIDKLEVVDPNTLKITLKAPFAPFLSVLTDRAGMMVSKAAVEKEGPEFERKPVGTGPFVVTEWTAKSQVVMKRNDSYWDQGKPYLDGVVYKIIPDETVRLTNLKTGDVDLLESFSPKDVKSVKESGQFTVVETVGQGYDYLDLNTARAPFENKALRQAVAWAVDRNLIQEKIYYNVGAAANGPFPASLWASDPNFAPYKRDVAKAKEKLKEGGKPDGFTFKLTITNNPLNVLISQVLQAQLKEAGITMNIDLVDSSALSAALNSGTYEAVRAGWSGRTDPDGNAYSMFVTGAPINYRKYSNKQVDDLLNKARTSLDQNERKGLYQQAAQIVADDAPLVFIHSDQMLHVMKKSVKGYWLPSDGRVRLGGVWFE